ncbi:GNAT family N-acetyltransferase [Jeongeupia naejangsanensis]|uniref:GNAT family N-acetyltransferase n=1 Tax=Jeongeupia naejangsanensis TaxID=613195 RepID=A0ABS2BN97_9NEIS|nr:GNAT family N-acetyltransferase [Jeongeupia naejangsanensis]MBM3117089.1 GNAT family N-acetyltransferase [Jeongeupia naejangsanensis]
MTTTIRRLTPADAPHYQALRLAALRDTPSAFGSSYEAEKDRPIPEIETRLAPAPDHGLFGAFDGDALVGTAGLGRESMTKLRHKAILWGMYVAPGYRQRGLAGALVREAVALAKSVDDLRQINLSVNAGNTAALRLYEGAGFRRYGLEPDALLVDSELHDEILMRLALHASK